MSAGGKTPERQGGSITHRIRCAGFKCECYLNCRLTWSGYVGTCTDTNELTRGDGINRTINFTVCRSMEQALLLQPLYSSGHLPEKWPEVWWFLLRNCCRAYGKSNEICDCTTEIPDETLTLTKPFPSFPVIPRNVSRLLKVSGEARTSYVRTLDHLHDLFAPPQADRILDFSDPEVRYIASEALAVDLVGEVDITKDHHEVLLRTQSTLLERAQAQREGIMGPKKNLLVSQNDIRSMDIRALLFKMEDHIFQWRVMLGVDAVNKLDETRNLIPTGNCCLYRVPVTGSFNLEFAGSCLKP